MGFSTINELIGRSDLLDKTEFLDHWKAKGLDFTKIFYMPEAERKDMYWTERQNHPLERVLDKELIEKAAPTFHCKQTVGD